MSSTVSNNKPEETRKSSRLRSIALPVLMGLLGIGITVTLLLLQDKIVALGRYGYLGAFLISLVGSATVILPVPGLVILFALGASLNPILVGLVAATGGIIGEMTGFMVGYGGRQALHGRSRLYIRAEKWMGHWGSWTIFAFAAIPLPIFDVAGMLAGALHYPWWKFLLIGWAGKSIKITTLVVAGAQGWQSILNYFS